MQQEEKVISASGMKEALGVTVELNRDQVEFPQDKGYEKAVQ